VLRLIQIHFWPDATLDTSMVPFVPNEFSFGIFPLPVSVRLAFNKSQET